MTVAVEDSSINCKHKGSVATRHAGWFIDVYP